MREVRDDLAKINALLGDLRDLRIAAAGTDQSTPTR